MAYFKVLSRNYLRETIKDLMMNDILFKFVPGSSPNANQITLSSEPACSVIELPSTISYSGYLSQFSGYSARVRFLTEARAFLFTVSSQVGTGAATRFRAAGA